MKRLEISELRDDWPSLLDRLPAEGVLITKAGEAIATLQPFRESDGDLIGALAGQLHIQGDILGTGEPWNAES